MILRGAAGPGGVPTPAPHPGRVRQGRERGAVTLEAAVAVLALAVVLAALAWCLVVLGAQLRSQDAARAGAVLAARAQPYADVRDEARRIVPGAQVTVDDASGGRVTVVVRRRLTPPLGLLSGLGSVDVVGVASARREQP